MQQSSTVTLLLLNSDLKIHQQTNGDVGLLYGSFDDASGVFEPHGTLGTIEFRPGSPSRITLRPDKDLPADISKQIRR